MSAVILTILYFTVVLPYGLGIRFLSDPLDVKTRATRTGWKARTALSNAKLSAGLNRQY